MHTSAILLLTFGVICFFAILVLLLLILNQLDRIFRTYNKPIDLTLANLVGILIAAVITHEIVFIATYRTPLITPQITKTYEIGSVLPDKFGFNAYYSNGKLESIGIIVRTPNETKELRLPYKKGLIDNQSDDEYGIYQTCGETKWFHYPRCEDDMVIVVPHYAVEVPIE